MAVPTAMLLVREKKLQCVCTCTHDKDFLVPTRRGRGGATLESKKKKDTEKDQNKT